MSQRKYSDEEVLDMLRECKEIHGECSPRVFRQHDEFCSVSYVNKHLDSWSKAKERAGIDEDLSSNSGRNPEYTEEQILHHLREADRRTDGVLTTEKMNDCDELISASVASERIGSWVEAKEKAGLSTPDGRENNSRPTAWSDEELIALLQEFAEVADKVTQREINRDIYSDPDKAGDNFVKQFPSASVYRKRFGTWGKAKEKAGIGENNTSGNTKYDRDDLLEMIRECAENHGGDCTASQFAADPDFCAPETVQRRFGSWNKAKEKAGICE